MSDPEVKEKRSRSRRRNMYAKQLRDHGEHKGAFALKVVDPRKGDYKRKRIRINEIDEEETD